MKHQRLPWNGQRIATVVLGLNQLNFNAGLWDLRSFLFYFLVLSVSSTQLPLGQTLNHATFDVYTPKTAETLIQRKWYRHSLFILLLNCVKQIFFTLSKRWVRMEYCVRLKRYCVSHIMRWRCRFHYRYVTNNILLTLQVYFARSIGH